MTALLIVLTPLLLLAIVSLFGFVGCRFQPGAASNSYSPVVQAAGAKAPTVSALLDVEGAQLLVATVQWGGSGTPQFSAQVGSGATVQCNFAPASEVNGGNPFSWNGINIQVFTGQVPANVDVLVVTVTLPSQDPSPVQWSLCIWPYMTSSQTLYGAVNTDLHATFVGTPLSLQTPSAVSVKTGDALYAVAFAADPPATAAGQVAFPGTNKLAAPSGFTTAADNSNDPILEGLVATANTGPVTAQVTDTNTNTNIKPLGFVLAFGVTIS